MINNKTIQFENQIEVWLRSSKTYQQTLIPLSLSFTQKKVKNQKIASLLDPLKRSRINQKDFKRLLILSLSIPDKYIDENHAKIEKRNEKTEQKSVQYEKEATINIKKISLLYVYYNHLNIRTKGFNG
ncbi:hypothetical protein OIU77_007040 [Salix suchowensis]|uniref:Uncharacterized protein n=1 Tax=Salix suchowensis TaxID=1278906 RepID=A0ABQ9APV1_9ROSI|nr:hypothetical protein OIU77_007040 [Salix suchowensis]